jgi:hypothetical protein
MLSAMSSTIYQPNPRKRPIDLASPEFPHLPYISLEATVAFAVKSQEALSSVPTISTNLASLFLPLISPHQLQQRFNIGDDNSVHVVMRKSYPLLKHEVDTLNRKYPGIYVRGPVGVGKSYLLYLLAAEHRLNRESYRVTYVNDCAMWRRSPYPYLLEELVTSFYDDTIEAKSIVEWCQAVTGSEKKEKMMIMMDTLINYTHENNLTWIIICDQHNAFYTRSVVVEQFPFNLIDILADNRASNIKVIVSASANNEGYPTEKKGWHTHDISSHRFDLAEYKVWCDHYLLENCTKVDHKSEEALDALFWTGGVPYELDLLWKQPKRSLIEKTMMYRTERVSDMAESHGKFCDKLSEEKTLNLKECIARMALRMDRPEIKVGMDRQLFDIIEEDGHEIITALNPVARRALIAFHGQGLMTSLGFVAEIVLKGTDYANSIKGKISEMYITSMLELSQLFAFQFRKVANIDKTGLPDDSIERKSIEIRSVVHFLTNKLPPKTSFHKNVTILFVPESPSYPRFDFFLWDSKRQVLMGFQVTVLNPFSDHPKMTNSQMWQRFCFGNSRQTPMELYWVVPKCCVGTNTASVVNDSIILFEDLVSNFPALGKLVLQ